MGEPGVLVKLPTFECQRLVGIHGVVQTNVLCEGDCGHPMARFWWRYADDVAATSGCALLVGQLAAGVTEESFVLQEAVQPALLSAQRAMTGVDVVAELADVLRELRLAWRQHWEDKPPWHLSASPVRVRNSAMNAHILANLPGWDRTAGASSASSPERLIMCESATASWEPVQWTCRSRIRQRCSPLGSSPPRGCARCD